MSNNQRKNQFPDFFTNKGSIPIKVCPLKFGNRTCYQSIIGSDNSEDETNFKPQLKPYLDNDDEMLDCADMEDNYEIILTKSGKFQTSFYVPSSLLSFIIGAKGSKLKALQKTTNTIIKIPRINETGDVIIMGETERKVASARTQISIIVAQRKERMPPTHFIAIPIINSETIQANLLKFKQAVLENPSPGVTESIFQQTCKIHLTITMLTLLDDEEMNLAKKTLQSFYDEHISKIFGINSKPNKITVRGLEIMNDDPENVRVLYAKVQMQKQEEMVKLQQICDKILMQFNHVGLAKKEFDRVKLHMTVMNTSFRDNSEKKISFDARSILEKFGDFNFGEFELNQLHICIRGTTINDSGEPKYYDTLLQLKF